MKTHQLINQTSGEVEYYTPNFIIEAARAVMGGIDLDPASSEEANKLIKATRFFTAEYDGLSVEWYGRVWLNHPFHKGEEVCNPETCTKKSCKERGFHCTKRIPNNADWINHLLSQYETPSGYIDEFCCITYACTSERWFQPLLKYCQCFLCPRTNYLTPNGAIKKGVTKGSVVTYGGPNTHKFKGIFSQYGYVK